MSRQQAWKELVPLLPYEPDLAKPEDREWAQAYLALLLRREVANLKDVSEEELRQAQRFAVLHEWSRTARFDRFGQAKMKQILDREIPSVVESIRQASAEELGWIQTWVLTGKLPSVETMEKAA